MTDQDSEVTLDPAYAAALDLPSTLTRRALAERLADLAGVRQPTTTEAIDFLADIGVCGEGLLAFGVEHQGRVDGASAGNFIDGRVLASPVSDAWAREITDDLGADPDPLASLLGGVIAERLAAAGHFVLL